MPDHYETIDAHVRELQDALKGLVDKLDEITNDPEFRTVWTVYHNHGGIYRGPKWVDALERARQALK